MITQYRIFFSIILVFFGINPLFSQEIELPDFATNVVIDQTKTLTPHEIGVLKTRLVDFEKTKGAQIAVLVLATTGDESIEQYGIRLAEKWQIGRENIDDGIILIVAMNDRKMRIEVGYGLEGAVSDIYAKRIIENIMGPQFKSGNFYNGIHEGVEAIIKLVNEEELPEVTSESESPLGNINPIFGFVALMVFLALRAFIKNKVVKFIIAIVAGVLIGFFLSSVMSGFIATGVALVSMFMSGGGGGSSGGGYYGGGYSGTSSYGGGFSGGSGGFSGGGGSFGGGGASGGW